MGGSFNSPFMFYFFKKERVKKKSCSRKHGKIRFSPKEGYVLIRGTVFYNFSECLKYFIIK